MQASSQVPEQTGLYLALAWAHEADSFAMAFATAAAIAGVEANDLCDASRQLGQSPIEHECWILVEEPSLKASC
jgi:hypothetical protein